MIGCRVAICILLFMIYLFETTTPRLTCGPNFCDNIKPNCVVPKCTANQIVKTNPKLCRCCPQCYTIKDHRKHCGEENFEVCKSGLRCIRNKCLKFTLYHQQVWLQMSVG
uniref:Uncharacterized protein LOC114330547 n=1 Tax=Diabrotica virgifera virgifera TaxID=50390 RepID=A0A6P7FIH1_DIAVI